MNFRWKMWVLMSSPLNSGCDTLKIDTRGAKRALLHINIADPQNCESLSVLWSASTAPSSYLTTLKSSPKFKFKVPQRIVSTLQTEEFWLLKRLQANDKKRDSESCWNPGWRPLWGHGWGRQGGGGQQDVWQGGGQQDGQGRRWTGRLALPATRVSPRLPPMFQLCRSGRPQSSLYFPPSAPHTGLFSRALMHEHWDRRETK